MKIFIKFFVSFLLFTAFYISEDNFFDSSHTKVEAATNIYKTTAKLNMRSGAGSNHKILLTIPNKTQLNVTSSKKVGNTTWYKTTYNKKTGWVSGKYLVKVTSKKNTTYTYKATAKLNLQSGAGEKYKTLLTIPNKTKITVTSSKKVGNVTWYKTTYNKKTGWVIGKNLVKVSNTTTDTFNLKTGKFYKNIYKIKNPSNTLVLVNKNNQLAKNYVPSKLRTVKVARRSDDLTKMQKTAATHLEKLFKAAKKDGIELAAWSGYRSYNTQKAAYNRWNKNDSISARPGHSEHQTGLAMDVIAKKDLKKSSPLSQSFGKTKEGKWLAKNAHKFGFIIRYPKGKEKITGYSYEPWHIRYVGNKVATKLYENDWTLEEAYIEGYLK